MDIDKMEVIVRGKLWINLEIIETIKANNTGEKQSQEMIKAWMYRPENTQHQVIVSVSCALEFVSLRPIHTEQLLYGDHNVDRSDHTKRLRHR